MSTPHNAPTYRISVDGRDITPTVNARLVRLQLEEARGDTADQLDLTLSDHDGRLQIPARGVTVALAIGWVGGPLIDKGTFVVDEAEHSGAPDQVTIRARSAEVGKTLRTRRDQSWHGLTLGDIVGTIATRNGLKTRIDATLAARALAHIDQTNESDLNFLSRLGKLYDAVATAKKGHLLFVPINGSKTASGAELPTISITRAEGDCHRYAMTDRDAYIGVKAYWHSPKQADRKSVLVPTMAAPTPSGGNTVDHNYKHLKETYATEADALAAATAEWQRIQRGLATLSLTLALGNPLLVPQSPVVVQGFKDQIDATGWLAVKVAHTLDDSGFVTRVEMETGST